jgi:hypothetical protein
MGAADRPRLGRTRTASVEFCHCSGFAALPLALALAQPEVTTVAGWQLTFCHWQCAKLGDNQLKRLGSHGVGTSKGIKSDLGTPASLAGPFTGATSVYVIVPGSEVRQPLTNLAHQDVRVASERVMWPQALRLFPRVSIATLWPTSGA